MEPSPRRHSPDTSVAKPAFRKLANDASGRRYRRHTPDSGSDSSSSHGSPKNIHKKPPSKEDPEKLHLGRRQECDRESVRAQHNRYGRDSSSYRNSNSHSYGHHRHDDHNRDEREADDNRMRHRSFRSGQDSKGNSHSDRLKRDNNFDKAGKNWQDLDRYSRDRHDSGGHRSKDKERNTAIGERQRYDRYDHPSDRSLVRIGHGDGGAWTDKRDRSRSPDDYKNDLPYSHRVSRGNDKGSSFNHLKEIVKDGKEEFGRHEDTMKKQKYVKELERQRDICAMDAEKETQNSISSSRHEIGVSSDIGKPVHLQEDQNSLRKKHKTGFSDAVSNELHHDNLEEEKSHVSSKSVKASPPKFTSDPTSQSGTVADVTAAKVAAMKVAELVNKNLTVGGIMSTDQKKKLLWGNKKNTAAEESSHRWDLPLFPDKERQEKFNKLMGVKGDVKPEPDNGGGLRSEKQDQLEIDLEKQYTAGLRRRDGRTVGLGL